MHLAQRIETITYVLAGTVEHGDTWANTNGALPPATSRGMDRSGGWFFLAGLFTRKAQGR